MKVKVHAMATLEASQHLWTARFGSGECETSPGPCVARPLLAMALRTSRALRRREWGGAP